MVHILALLGWGACVLAVEKVLRRDSGRLESGKYLSCRLLVGNSEYSKGIQRVYISSMDQRLQQVYGENIK
jgi:hypothetical protein